MTALLNISLSFNVDSTFTNNKSWIYLRANRRNHDRTIHVGNFFCCQMFVFLPLARFSDASIPSLEPHLYVPTSRDSWSSDRHVPLSSRHAYTSLYNSGVACSGVSIRRYIPSYMS